MEDTDSTSSPADATDEDRDFIPHEYAANAPSSSDSETETPCARPKKRIRKERNWKKNKAKSLRNSGKEYVGSKNEVKRAKSVQEYVHNCKYQCNEFTEDGRKVIFEQFWQLGSWNVQNAFINGCIEKGIPKRMKRDAEKHKSVSVVLKLQNKRICKMFFLKTLDISVKRYDNIVKSRRESGVSPTDMRGKHVPANKISDDDKKIVKKHIESFPKYSSHYTRAKTPHRKYLSTELSVHKMYELYVQHCQERGINNPVKESYYRYIFNTCFNLSFKKPLTDTCNTCDRLQNAIANSEDQTKVEESKVQKELHLRKAERARTAKNEAKTLAVGDKTLKAICFDLEKTLPTPVLTCSKVYYMRQLWTYNLGIHELDSGNALMFMWHEAEGSRGSQEIGSCLLKFVKQLDPSVTHLIAFSDNCGGQNKSRFVLKFWMHIVQNTNIITVDHKFMVPGHSYMECDQDFGVIENAKKKHQYVWVPDDWVNVVAHASRKFQVIRMTQIDFKSVEPMKNLVMDKIIGISKFQWIRFQKAEPYTLYYKESLNEDLPFSTRDLTLKKSGPGRHSTTFDLKPLYTEKLSIAAPKYKDLQELLPFIPPVHHQFYKDLPNSKQQAAYRNEVNEELPQEELDQLWDSD